MTSIADNFNRANSDTLGTLSDGSGSWTEVAGDNDIVSNTCAGGAAGSNYSRADVDLASAAHYAQIDVVSWTGSSAGQAAGICTRYSSSADTCYVFYIRRDTSNYRLFKRVAGSLTQIGSTVTEALPSLPFTVKLSSSSGDVHTCAVNGTTKLSPSDSSITGNTRTGLFTGNVSTDVTSLDAFSAADLAAGTAVPVFYYHLTQQGIA